MAARTGVDFIAPYVNRIDNISGNGVNVVYEISKLLEVHKLDSKILAASFKNIEQVHRASLAGANAVTLPLDIMENLISHPLTDSSIDKFVSDWEKHMVRGNYVPPLKSQNLIYKKTEVWKIGVYPVIHRSR